MKHFNAKHIKLDVVGSTNSYLQELNKHIKQGCGTMVSANYQSNGRGQKGNVWEVLPGENLTVSVVVYPKISPKYAFYLNVITSLAVQKTLSDLNIESKIKWPNDILVEQKKIGGILIENQISGANISQSVIGIGLNVNQVKFEGLNATSIKREGVHAEIEDILSQIYQYLDFYYNLLVESNFKLLLKHYYSNLFLYQQTGVFEDLNGRFNAKVNGVTEIGLLNLLLEDGTRQTYDLKEVKFIY